MFVPRQRAKHRQFDYEPRYYNPEREQKLRQRMRVKAKVQRRSSPTRAMYFGLLLCLAIYIYSKLG